MTALESAPIEVLGSSSMKELASLIHDAVVQHRDAVADFEDTQRLVGEGEATLERARRSLLNRWFGRSRVPRLEQALEDARGNHAEAARRLAVAAIDLDFDLEADRLARFDDLTTAFVKVAGSASVWDITSKADNDQRTSRSAAKQVVTRNRVGLAVEELPPAIRSRSRALRFGNANGAALHLLPALLLVGQPDGALAVIDLRQLSIEFEVVSTVEREPVPVDAHVMYETWERVNKDGTPDRLG